MLQELLSFQFKTKNNVFWIEKQKKSLTQIGIACKQIQNLTEGKNNRNSQSSQYQIKTIITLGNVIYDCLKHLSRLILRWNF